MYYVRIQSLCLLIFFTFLPPLTPPAKVGERVPLPLTGVLCEYPVELDERCYKKSKRGHVLDKVLSLFVSLARNFYPKFTIECIIFRVRVAAYSQNKQWAQYCETSTNKNNQHTIFLSFYFSTLFYCHQFFSSGKRYDSRRLLCRGRLSCSPVSIFQSSNRQIWGTEQVSGGFCPDIFSIKKLFWAEWKLPDW